MSGVKRILHLASFSGNIGDNINHAGFRPWFAGLCDVPIEWHQLEIRKFYRGELSFSRDFPKFASESDAVVVGGGNYLELWPTNTVSGMTLDLPMEQMGSWETPILLNALGVDGGQGVSERGRQGLQVLVDWIAGDSRRLLSVRNDGSFAQVEALCRPSSLAHVHRVPDAGFFQVLSQPNTATYADSKQISVNLAMDMGSHRYPGGRGISYSEFCTLFAQVVAEVSASQAKASWVFVPHIYSDLRIISDVLAELPDSLRRTRVEVAAYGSGVKAAQDSMATYANSDLVLGMRFHSCIAGLSLGIPTIGLVNYPQVQKLFSEVGASQLAMDVSTAEGVAKLSQTILATLDDQSDSRRVAAEVLYRVGAERRRFEATLIKWLVHSGLTRSLDADPS